MFDADAIRTAIEPIAVRGQVALQLTAIEWALARYGVADDRIADLVEALWTFVEILDVTGASDRSFASRAGDLLAAFDQAAPLPDSYRDLPPFIISALYDTWEIVWVYSSWQADRKGEESLISTMHVLELCAQHNVPIPQLAPFAQLAFPKEYGPGPTVPRAVFGERSPCPQA
jgi:hypothetical protein